MLQYEGSYVLPIRPNWSSSVDAQWEYKTEIFMTEDGTEYRRSQREKPRYRLEFNSTEGGDAAMALRTALAVSAGRKTVIPDFPAAVSYASAGVATASFPMTEVPYWIRTGRPMAFLSRKTFQVAKVISTIDNVVVVDAVIPAALQYRIAPVVYGRARGAITSALPASKASVVGFDFDEDPTTALDPLDPLKPENVDHYFRGYPVLPFQPNWASPVNEQFTGRLDVVDYSYGAAQFFLPEQAVRWGSKFQCLAKTNADSERIKDFFFRRRGQRGVFYCPTWAHDMTFVSIDAADRRKVTVAGSEIRALFNSNIVYRNIAMVTPTGLLCAGVLSTSADGENTILNLDLPVPGDVVWITKMCWLFMARFASDQLGMSWKTNTVASYTIAVTSLIDRFYELTINGDRVTVGGDYVVVPPRFRRSTFIPMTVGGELVLFGGEYVG